MSKSPDPAFDEVRRLGALRDCDLLDTPPEAAFDRLAALAADLFDTPIGLVSLVDEDRQWFKARVGLDETETPREWSFCAHAVEGGAWETLVVEDATADSRFVENPLVTGAPGIRFYAGVALTDAEGQNLGTLCVIDRKRRPAPGAAELERLRRLACIVVDEIELRKATRALAGKQQLLELAESVAGVGSWRYSVADGRVIWSDEVYRIYGLEPGAFDPNVADAIGFYHPDDQPVLRRHLAAARESGTGYLLRLRLIRRDGAERIVMSRAECQLDAGGAVAVIQGVFQDVTDSERTLRRAQRSEARLRSITDGMADVVTRLRRGGASNYISPSISSLLGYQPHEMAGQSSLNFVHPDDRDLVAGVIGRLEKQDGRDTIRHRALHRNGDTVWVETSFRHIAGETEDEGEVVAVIRDVSERRRLEAELEQSEMRFRLLADNSSDMLVRWGVDGVVRDISAACRMLGVEREEVIGKQILSLVAPEQLAGSQAMIDQLLRDHRAEPDRRREHLVRTRDGREVWLEGRPRLVFNADGEPAEVVSVLRDVSARKAAEEAMTIAKAEAEAAAEAKAQFLANMSHELRTPLTAVVAFARLAAEQPELSETTRRYVERLTTGARALMATVNDILDFSKLEAGQVDIRPGPVAPARLVEEAVSMFETLAGDRGLALSVEGAGDLPACVALDEDRVRQVLLNLIGNAVKFTEAGGVTVRVRWSAADGELLCQVRDTGPGIASGEMARLFQRFSQVDDSLTRKQGGTGLGLAICKGLIEAMGGEIGAESTPGEGSCFHFRIPAPLAVDRATAPGDDAGTLGQAVRALLVDDNETNREIVSLMLEPFGVEVVEATNGLEAVGAALKRPYDVILMDLRMPVMDGVEAATRIRGQDGPNRRTPIVAFSADVMIDHPLFDGAVAKPVDPAALITTLAAALEAGAGNPTA